MKLPRKIASIGLSAVLAMSMVPSVALASDSGDPSSSFAIEQSQELHAGKRADTDSSRFDDQAEAGNGIQGNGAPTEDDELVGSDDASSAEDTLDDNMGSLDQKGPEPSSSSGESEPGGSGSSDEEVGSYDAKRLDLSLIDYVLLESPEMTSEDVQTVVVGFADDGLVVDDARLVVVDDESGRSSLSISRSGLPARSCSLFRARCWVKALTG